MCIHMCVHACMEVWTFRSMYMCFHMYIDVCAHACVYVHFLQYPSTSIEVGIAGSPPPPQYWKASYAYEPSILGSPFETQNYFTFIPESKKWCKDQQPIHSSTTFDPWHSIGKWKNTINHHIQESQEVSPFQAGDHKTAINRRQDSMTNTKHK